MEMNPEEDELTKTEEWFRDKLNNLMGLGGAAVLIIAGWLISHDSVFSLAHTDADKHEAAIFLCTSAPLAWALWYVALLKTHSKCPAHPTVIRRRFLHLYIVGAGVVLFIMVLLAVDGVTF